MIPKYPAEFFLEFFCVDRFLFRVSDLFEVARPTDKELFKRLDDCHIYLVGKRPRLSVVPDSVEATKETVQFKVEYRLDGTLRQRTVCLPRSAFSPREVSFEASPYPHRDLISRDHNGHVIAQTWISNFVHLIPDVEDKAKDLEVVYVGQGLRKSATDRLRNHKTLQHILAGINSHEPDAEAFALIYAFAYRKNAATFINVPVEISGDRAKRRREKALAYKPSLKEQIALIEASVISYFKTQQFNTHYINFPNGNYRLLKKVYEADFAAITVQLDNTNIGGQRTYSTVVLPSRIHLIIVDFRHLEGKYSTFTEVACDMQSKH